MQEQSYQQPESELLASLSVDETLGLSSKEARERLLQYGYNTLVEAKKEPLWRLFLAQFQDFMVLVLLGATALSAFLGEIPDAITIVAIVIVNAVLGFVQEFRAEKSLDTLRQLTAPIAQVRRDGRSLRIPAKEVVPGDLLIVEAGDRPAADARLIKAVALSVEESALTGEAVPVEKKTGTIRDENVSLGDRFNMLFSGTTVTRGHALALVTATGMQTEMGKIADLMDQGKAEDTPLQKRLEGLGKILVIGAVAVCGVVVITGVLRGEELYRMFLTGVSLAVAAIPEGLPAIVTIALAVGVQRMIKRRAVVRRLPAVETLGCATVICSDKTGTLTTNQMTVREVYLTKNRVQVSGEGYHATGDFRVNGQNLTPALKTQMQRLLGYATLCSNASVLREGKKVHIEGDPTEAALLVAAQKFGLNLQKLNQMHPRQDERPFESETRRMSVWVTDRDDHTVIVKGAPESILPLCKSILEDGTQKKLTEAERNQLLLVNEDMARRALRVLAVAYKEKVAPQSTEQDLVFYGLIGMMDPPRPEARDAVLRCRRAGIRTIMVTGDHPVTAEAIADELGLLQPGLDVAVGKDLDDLSDDELRLRLKTTAACARVSPALKLRIVQALKQQGEVVAMTGDGVNDAPALKEADIGIAMGQGGTEVAKEASAMILGDDNFATIVAAVEEGRSIYENIRKFIRYLLSCNVGEVLVMFFAALLGAPTPLIPIQILWVNLVTDGLPAMALGVDPADPDNMQRPPRPPQEGVFARGLGRMITTRGLLIGISTLAVFLLALSNHDSLAKARTLAFATLVGNQLFHVFDARSESKSIFDIGFFSNMYLVGAVASSILLLLAAIYIPWMQKSFETVPLSLNNWALILVVSALGSLGIGLRRFVVKAARGVS